MTAAESHSKYAWLYLPSCLTLLSLIIAMGGERWTTWLRYDREAILAGEYWRLFTAHLCHLGWPHLIMNIAGLLLIWALFGRLLSLGAWLTVLCASALAVSGDLLWFDPAIRWYVGLSGVLHGLFIAGVITSISRGEHSEYLLLAFVIGKLAWEQRYGALPGSESFAGGHVVVDAHLYGALGGLLGTGIILPWRNLFTRKRSG